MTRKLTPAQLDEIEAVAKKADSEVSWAVETRGIEVRIPQVVSHQGLLDPDDAEHVAMMDPATTLALVAEVRELRAKVERVREVHEPIDALLNPGRHERVVKVCIGCGTDDGNWQRYPCPTIRALGEGA